MIKGLFFGLEDNTLSFLVRIGMIYTIKFIENRVLPMDFYKSDILFDRLLVVILERIDFDSFKIVMSVNFINHVLFRSFKGNFRAT